MKHKLKIALAQFNPLVGDAVTNVKKLITVTRAYIDAED